MPVNSISNEQMKEMMDEMEEAMEALCEQISLADLVLTMMGGVSGMSSEGVIKFQADSRDYTACLKAHYKEVCISLKKQAEELTQEGGDVIEEKDSSNNSGKNGLH